MGKSEGKRLLGRPRHRRKYNIMIKLMEADFIELARHRDIWWLLVNALMNFWIP